jgi:heme A synthase
MVLMAHSGFRYLVLLVGVVVIAYAAWGMATKREYDKTMRVLSAVFTGMVDLTALLGLAMILTGTFYPQLGGHIVMMVLAVAVVHVVSAVMKRRPPEQRTYTPHVVGTLIVLAIISSGILAIGRPIIG